jgi:fucose 4-O-acetylase-like acetyltransferase
MSYYRNKGAVDLVSSTGTVASSSFLKTKGQYVGGVMSVLWLGLAVYLTYYVYNMEKSEDKKYYYAGVSVLFLLVLSGNIYYFVARNKGDEENKKSTNSIYANIIISPIYLIVIGFAIAIAFSMK